MSHTPIAEIQMPLQTLLMHTDQTLPVLLGSQLHMMNLKLLAEFILN